MEEKKRGSGGNPALHALAFVGVALALIMIALFAALFIATKGPSEAARAEVYDWAAERGLQGVAGIFLSAEEKDALADVPGENPPAESGEPAGSGQPLIVVTDEAPVQSSEPAEPETSPETEEGEEAE